MVEMMQTTVSGVVIILALSWATALIRSRAVLSQARTSHRGRP